MEYCFMSCPVFTEGSGLDTRRLGLIGQNQTSVPVFQSGDVLS